MESPKSYPLVSIVITCFNYGKYLRRCVDSALQQSYLNLEIIVVDDGSTDDTEQVIIPYLDDPKITYIRQQNRGQAVAKNVGINQSCGDFIAFLDADDLWCPEKITKQMAYFEDKDVGVVYCRAMYLDENNDELDYEMNGTYLKPQQGMVTKWLLFDNFVQFSSTVVRKDCFAVFKGFDESLKMGIDWDLWLRISTMYKFGFVDDRLFYYRMGHPGQMSKNSTERQKCSDRIIDKFLTNFPNFVTTVETDKMYAYTYCNRGSYFRNIDKKQSYQLYFKAIAISPFWIPAYKGLLKNILCLNEN